MPHNVIKIPANISCSSFLLSFKCNEYPVYATILGHGYGYLAIYNNCFSEAEFFVKFVQNFVMHSLYLFDLV